MAWIVVEYFMFSVILVYVYPAKILDPNVIGNLWAYLKNYNVDDKSPWSYCQEKNGTQYLLLCEVILSETINKIKARIENKAYSTVYSVNNFVLC